MSPLLYPGSEQQMRDDRRAAAEIALRKSSAEAMSKPRRPIVRVGTGEGLAAFASQRDKYAREVEHLKRQREGVDRAIAVAEAKLEAAEEIIGAVQAANTKVRDIGDDALT